MLARAVYVDDDGVSVEDEITPRQFAALKLAGAKPVILGTDENASTNPQETSASGRRDTPASLNG